jgi:hypothetical protein
LVLVFYKARGGLIFNNTEEVQPHYWQVAMVWLGLDCMYRPLSIESSMGGGSNTSAEVKNLWLWDFEVSRFEGARL